MIKKIADFFFSSRLMGVVILIFAAAMAVATFIENNHGTPTAKSLIYNAKWFELLFVLLGVNFIGNIFRYKLLRKEKWPVLLFHIAFIVILLGAVITRYNGYEGLMPIREGKQSDKMFSDKTFINVRVDDDKIMKSYEDAVLFGRIGKNSYTLSDVFRHTDAGSVPFRVELLQFVPNAYEVFVEEEQGGNYIHLVEADLESRNDIYLKEGETKVIRDIPFTFNHPAQEGMNFLNYYGELQLQAPFSGSVMEMQTQEVTTVPKDSLLPFYTGRLYSFGDLRFVVPGIRKGKVQIKAAKNSEKNRYPFDRLILKVSSDNEVKIVNLEGAVGASPQPQKITLNGLNFVFSYGSKEIQLPFALRLRDFEMERYPGTNSASSYASEVTVIDKDKVFDYRIFMNHVLDYKGYRFFQASYDKDEKGTILSVNHDRWGTLVTYIGYFLMSLGMFFTLFWKGTRFQTLSSKLKKLSLKKHTVLLFFLGCSALAWGQEDPTKMVQQNAVSKEHAARFGKLLIQDYQGRTKPVNTYALEGLRKIYKKDHYKGLTAEQVLLGAQLDPVTWGKVPIIHIKSHALGDALNSQLRVKDKSTSIANFYNSSGYMLSDKVNDAYHKKNIDRTATDKEIINLDERVNVWWNILNGTMMNIYPKKGDANNKWYLGIDRQVFVAQDTMVLKMHQNYMSALQNAIRTNDYSEADFYLDIISKYQKKLGAAIIPSAQKVELEVKYNQWHIFKNLLFYYLIVGFILLILAFIDMFRPKNKLVQVLLKSFVAFTVLGMTTQVAGLAMRWYISGHEPWSNGYEAIVFISFISTLAGLIYSHKKNKFSLAATVLFASFLLGIAHGSLMNPEITNLVPVLKSYWLMIHVAVITSSYGFLGLGSLLGFIVLLLYILRTPSNASRLNTTISELTYINESTLTVGLFTLTIGTFLGGIWANESWGRYWSWDPKEVWSLISIMVYVFVLHVKLIPGLRDGFTFNLLSLFAIATLIMTYFGVNYYLSGMHSYAAGDPIPIPSWIYFAVSFFMLFALVSYVRYRDFKKRR